MKATIIFVNRKYTGKLWKYITDSNPVPIIAEMDTVRYEKRLYPMRFRSDIGFRLLLNIIMHRTAANESWNPMDTIDAGSNKRMIKAARQREFKGDL